MEEAVKAWDAAWESTPGGGKVHLPVLAGIRRGRVLGRIDVLEIVDGSCVRLTIENEEYEVNRPALFMLLLGTLGGLLTVIWPLNPERLLALVPVGLVFLVGAWLLVVSRLRTAGIEDFLDTVAEIAVIEAQNNEVPENEGDAPTPIEP